MIKEAALSNIPSYFTRNSPEPAGASSASISMTKVIEKAKRIVDNNKEMGREMSRVDMMRSALKVTIYFLIFKTIFVIQGCYVIDFIFCKS